MRHYEDELNGQELLNYLAEDEARTIARMTERDNRIDSCYCDSSDCFVSIKCDLFMDPAKAIFTGEPA